MSAAAARVGDQHAAFGDRTPVETRPCRGCGEQTPVTATGKDALKACNTILLARNEMPLNESRIFACERCERCELKVRDAIGQSNRDKVEEMRAIILDLREAVDPPSERAMLERLNQLGHPDVTGLLHAIGERKSEEKTKGGRRR